VAELVSILIPAYKAERWIGESVTSAIGQTWPKKEIIIVDDGSPDRTLEVARSFESRMVKVITQENMGVCGARNKGLSLAQGDYIQWLDADDILHPEKIALQLQRGDSGPDSLVLRTCSWGKFFYRTSNAKFQPDSLWQDLEPVEWLINKFANGVWMNPSVWLVSRKLIELAGSWDETLSGSGDDDGEYACRLVSRSERVHFVQKAKCYYRIGNCESLVWKGLGAPALRYQVVERSINRLLSIENSERTRNACLKYLQSWFPLFYLNGDDMVRKVKDLARTLGGSVSVPKGSWKESVVRSLLGYETGERLLAFGRKCRLSARKNWDRLLHEITGRENRFC
jgi:glycosyltransferase involved in cell wall biosynthesis